MPDQLTAAQRAVWFAQAQVGAAPVYQCAERVDIVGQLDVERFAATVQSCLSRIPALNSRYLSIAGTPHSVSDPRQHDVVVHDVAEGLDDPVAAVIDAALTTSPIVDSIGGEQLSAQHLVRRTATHHVWIVRVHHIAIDGYSLAALLRWVADCYRADADALPDVPFVPALPAPATDVDDAAFWSRYCDDARPPSPSRLAPTPATRRALRVTHRLPPRTSTTDRGWTESLVAALGLYVGTLTRETDAVIGMPWANRRMGARQTIEPEVNILPLRVHTTPTLTVGQLVDHVSAEIRTVRPHSRYRADQIRRDRAAVGSDHPLYGPVANLKFFTPRLDFGTATATITNIAMGPVDDLTVTASPMPDGGLTLEVEGNPDRYTDVELGAHAGRLRDLIGQLADAPADTPLGALAVASITDSTSEVHGRNATDDAAMTDEANTRTLTDLLDDAASVHAGRTALRWGVDGENELSYQQLRSAAADLALVLRQRGVGRGTIVALRMARSAETVCALLAVLACGAAYLPIDPELPTERIDGMLDDSDALALITAESADPAAIGWAGHDLSMWITVRHKASDASGDRPDHTPTARHAGQPTHEPDHTPTARRVGQARNELDRIEVPPPARPSPRDTAYVIFTSGSTGRPKGVAVEHRSIVNRLRWMDNAFALTPDDRVLQKTPYSFDVSVWEFFWPLITGATLVLAGPGVERDSPALATELATRRITVCHFVPSALAAFTAAARTAEHDFTALRLVACSGEALPPETLTAAREVLPHTDFHNLYGPTEAAVDVTDWSPSPDWTGTVVPIGVPIANTSALILDTALRPQVPGGVGELYLAGIQLARGYLGRPALTATRFVVNPFQPGERMYATGDLVYRADDGAIVYLGRTDDQVKVRGRRIELGEIQAALAALPSVDTAVVVTRELTDRSPATTVIVGYVVPAAARVDPASFDAATARDQLARRLPAYMVPDAIEALDAIPMTRNGKLDRRRLPEPRLGAVDIVAPRSPAELTLAALFADAVGRPAVSVTDSFFDLGGTSLSASMLAARCADVLGSPVTVADLFAAPSVAALAAHLAGDRDVDPFGRLLRFRAGAAGQAPIFAIHPAGGLGWCYAGLLPVLDPAVGLYAIQADGLADTDATLPDSLTAISTSYLDTIESVAPHGPIRLLGWSVGGVIAHEIAAQAQSRGRDVAPVVLLDAYPSECWSGRPAPSAAEIRRALLIMAGTESASDLDSDHEVLAALRDGHAALASLSIEQVRRITDVVAHFATLMRDHRTSAIAGAAWHFAAAESTEAFLPASAWEAHVRGTVHRIDLPVRHPGMVSPESLAAIAAHLPTDVGADAVRTQVLTGAPTESDVAALGAALRTHGTPVITDSPTDPSCQRALFTFAAGPDVAGVYLWVNRLTDGPDTAAGMMTRWGDTDLWFTELPIDRDTLATYRFYPFAADDPALHEGVIRYSRDVARRALVDPTNPVGAQSPFGSVLRAEAAPQSDWPTSAVPIELLDSGVVDGPDGPARWRLTPLLGGGAGDARIVVVFDADKWFDTLWLPTALRHHTGGPLALLGIDSPTDATARLRQLGPDRDFLGRIVESVLPQAHKLLDQRPTSVVWVGQSVGALPALAAAAWYPDAVDEVLAYSPSLWWRPGLTGRPAAMPAGRPWIADLLAGSTPRAELRLAVGRYERVLVSPVRQFAADLERAGRRVRLSTAGGGHDIAWWATELLTDLATPSTHSRTSRPESAGPESENDQ